MALVRMLFPQLWSRAQLSWYSFALKIVFTAVTIGAGFKGGEIVPTMLIGSTFGCAAASCAGIIAPVRCGSRIDLPFLWSSKLSHSVNFLEH